MKLSELWLREWIDSPLSTNEIAKRLTLCGLEVESLTPVAEKFSNVVIAQVVSIEKHPEADRLHVCQVDVGQAELLTIVCGATNLKLPMKVPAALVGAVLPHNIKITRSKIRGIVSNGMLCSARELTLTEESNGIVEFPADAPIGQDVWDYLTLSDQIIDLAISPNRGDCLSVLGMAREIAAITACHIKIPAISKVESTVPNKLPVTVIDVAEECPRYVGRVITQIKPNATTPIWLQERLHRSSIRCIHPIVDVMNYVMLELGQPMHAFDLQKIAGGIQVRFAKPTEELALLDGQVVKLNQETVVIADEEKPLAIAGVMGGLDSGVTSQTQAVFLESAIFQPHSIARARQKYNLRSESSHRFERGIDPTLQTEAIERATALLLEIVGGQAGPLVEVMQQKYLPSPTVIPLRTARIKKIVGFSIEDEIIATLLQRLHFIVEKNATGFQVTVPAYRSDITLEIDLIEEIIRLYGYENIPPHQATASLQMNTNVEKQLDLSLVRQAFCDLGYHEVITYSFINQKQQQRFDPANQAKMLVNPITAEMSVMRTNLWPGLIDTLLYNQHRQQSRVRLFETGLRFVPQPEKTLQQKVISGLVSGTALPEQWGIATREVDFFDLKGDLLYIIGLTMAAHEFHFKAGTHPALHPGQTAEIWRAGRYLGVLGALHPSIANELDITGQVLLFELLLDELMKAHVPHAIELSKFPEIRRDIAIYIDQTVPSQLIQDTIAEVSGELLKGINVFDVYQGKGVPPNHKSIALALTLQHSSRTLLDEEVADIINSVVSALKQQFAAELRG
jgi:phenylalanyl-tRNA synthetase beta chain